MKRFLCEESVLRHNKRKYFPSYLDHYLKQSTGKLAWLRLQRVVEGGSGLFHSYGSFSHDDVGVPKQ